MGRASIRRIRPSGWFTAYLLASPPSRDRGPLVRKMLVLAAAVVAVAAPVCGCSSSGSAKSAAATSRSPSTTTAAPTTSTTPSLKEQVRRSWEGIQLDVIGAKPAPVGTTLFFQHGNWAAEVLWKSPNKWCLLNTYTWHVTDAQSPTQFTVRYDRTHAIPGVRADTRRLHAERQVDRNQTAERADRLRHQVHGRRRQIPGDPHSVQSGVERDGPVRIQDSRRDAPDASRRVVAARFSFGP